MQSNSIISSASPDCAYIGSDETSRLKDCRPETKEGLDVLHISERLRTLSQVDPADIELISLAAAAHADVLNGQPLLWVDSEGEAMMAFEPGTQRLWHKDPVQLSCSGRPAAVVRFADGQYSAVVDGEFIVIEGDEALYKALLTAVHQYGDGIVTDLEGKNLRNTLSMFMRTEADKLGLLWQDQQQGRPIGDMLALPGNDNSQFPSSLAEQDYRAFDAEGTFTFVPRITNKGRVLESIACLMNHSSSLINNPTLLVNNSYQPADKDNILLQPFTLQHEEVALGFDYARNGKVTHNSAVLPLIASTTASAAVRHPAGSKTLRTAVGGLGLTGFFFAGKQLLSWYQGRNNPIIAPTHQSDETSFALSHVSSPSPLAIQLENTDDDFAITTDNNGANLSMSDDDKIAYRLTLSALKKISSSTIMTTTRRGTDDVSIEQLNLSCAEKGLQLTVGDVFRQIGETLSYPVTELSKAVQVIIYYEQYRQCPSEQDIEKLEYIASRIDTFISTFISYLPGSNPFSLAQSIGGPLFKLLADAIDDKELDMSNVNAINDQLLFLARTTWKFTPRGRHGEVKPKKIAIPGKTSFKKNKLSALINHDFFNLHREGEHYIGTSAHAKRPIKYSPSQGEWVFHDKNAYLYEEEYHKNMVSDYGVNHDYIRSIKTQPDSHHGISIDNRNNIMHVLKRDNRFSKFIVMNNGKNNVNVESGFYKINGVDYGYAKKFGLENRIVKFNRNVFYFEARSAKINKALVESIDNGAVRHTLSEHFHVTTMKPDGFSYDNNGNKYLKYNNGYFKIETDENDFTYLVCRKHNKSKRVYIMKNQEDFFDVDQGFSWTMMEQQFIETTEGFFIKRELADDIDTYCMPYDGPVDPNADKGIFRNDDGEFYLSLNGKLYELSEYNRDFITIRTKHPNDNGIRLYMAKDYFFETKSNDQIEERGFLDISASCKIKRSPVTGSCDTAFISSGADSSLRSKAKQSIAKLGGAEDNLQLLSVFPNLFLDPQSKKSYFKYDGQFYRADLTNGLELNVLKQATLYIHCKDTFGGRKNIVSLVYDKIGGKTVIQTLEEKLQWRAGMTVKESIDFVRDNDFLKIPDFGRLEDVVMDVNRKKTLKFTSLTNTYSTGDIKESIRAALGYRSNNFEIYSMEDISDAQPLYLRGGALLVRNSINHATAQIDIAIRELKHLTPNAQKYVGYVLGVENDGFIRDFSKQLEYKLNGIKRKINENNIKLVAMHREVMPNENFEIDMRRDADTLLNPPVNDNYYHKAALPERARRLGVYAFVPLNAERNIHICLDRLHFIDPTHPDKSLRKKHFMDITETIIHEAAHSSGIDPDITYISMDDGKLAPVLDAIDEYTESIVRRELNDEPAFIKMRRDYMALHPEYSVLAETLRDDANSLNYFFSHDTGFKANVLLNTPDFLAIFARDLAANSAVKLRA